MLNKLINSYSKVYNVGHPAVTKLFNDPVTVEEKIDGSQFSFGVIDGELFCRSKNSEQIYNVDKMFMEGVEWVKANQDKLIEGWIYRGEYLQKPKHNVLEYDRIPDNHIIIYDIDMSSGLYDYLTYDEKVEEAARIGLETVPMLYEGTVPNLESLKDLLDTTSCLGSILIEGIVIKNYNQWTKDKKTMMGKYVRPSFREKHAKKYNTTGKQKKDIIGHLIDVYRTEARWRKAIQHRREDGELLNAPQDIGPLIKRIQQDVKDECEEEIKDKVFRWVWPKINRKLAAGFPEWYKEQLAKKAFKDDE